MPYDGNLTDLQNNRKKPEELLAGLKASHKSDSHKAGLTLLSEAGRYGLSVKDYLTLAIDPQNGTYAGLNGYDAAKVYLNLPVKDDFKEGIVLQAASETFQTFPGTRALFPPVIDDMLYFSRRQDQIERVEPMLAGSRTINGPELLFTVVDDTAADTASFSVPEGSRIPVRSIRSSENSVRFFKHGSGIRTTYEFNRRARLDMLTPFAARVARELELSKVRAGTAVLINGDGLPGSAAPVVTQSSFNAQTGETATNGRINYLNLLAWLVARAQAGAPVDTVVGNWDAAFQWMRLFQPQFASNMSQADAMRQMSGMAPSVIPIPMPTAVNFVVSSSAPATRLIGYVRGETMEQLVESGSDIAEEEKAMSNQTITYYRTENTGMRLVYRDTRSIYNFGG